MTPGTCSVCSRTDAAAIDDALAAGGTVRDVSQQFNLKKSSVHRHRRAHLQKRLRTAVEARQAEPAGYLLDLIAELTEETLRILRKALRAKDLELALKAIARAERQAELTAKLTGQIREGGTTVNVTNLNVDAETGTRMATMFLERHGPARPQLPSAPDTEPSIETTKARAEEPRGQRAAT